MNYLKNNVQLIGNLGMDPEVKTLNSGRKVTNFKLATNDSYKTADGDYVQKTQWHKVVAWGKLAETMAKHLKKGKEIAISGKLVHRSFETDKGETRYVTEIVANGMVFLGKKEI